MFLSPMGREGSSSAQVSSSGSTLLHASSSLPRYSSTEDFEDEDLIVEDVISMPALARVSEQELNSAESMGVFHSSDDVVREQIDRVREGSGQFLKTSGSLLANAETSQSTSFLSSGYTPPRVGDPISVSTHRIGSGIEDSPMHAQSHVRESNVPPEHEEFAASSSSGGIVREDETEGGWRRGRKAKVKPIGDRDWTELLLGGYGVARAPVIAGGDENVIERPTDSQTVILEGIFEKRGHFIRNWKERVFRLYADRIDYLTQEGVLKGTIPLSSSSRINLEELKDGLQYFSLSGSGKSFLFRTRGEGYARKWMETLNSVVSWMKS